VDHHQVLFDVIFQLFIIFMIFSLKLFSFHFSKILNFTKFSQSGKIIVFGLHLFFSLVSKPKSIKQEKSLSLYQENDFSKLKFILHSSFVVSQ